MGNGGYQIHKIVTMLGLAAIFLGFFIVRGLLARCGRHVRRAKVGKLRGAGAYDLADFSESEREMVGLAESPHPLAGHVLGVGELEPFVDQRGDTGLRSALQAIPDIRHVTDWNNLNQRRSSVRRGRVGIGGIKWDQSG